MTGAVSNVLASAITASAVGRCPHCRQPVTLVAQITASPDTGISSQSGTDTIAYQLVVYSVSHHIGGAAEAPTGDSSLDHGRTIVPPASSQHNSTSSGDWSRRSTATRKRSQVLSSAPSMGVGTGLSARRPFQLVQPAVASQTSESPDAGTPAETIVVRASGLVVRGGKTVTAGNVVPSAGELAVFCRPVVMAPAAQLTNRQCAAPPAMQRG